MGLGVLRGLKALKVTEGRPDLKDFQLLLRYLETREMLENQGP